MYYNPCSGACGFTSQYVRCEANFQGKLEIKTIVLQNNRVKDVRV
jgi:hypothetical protein